MEEKNDEYNELVDMGANARYIMATTETSKMIKRCQEIMNVLVDMVDEKGISKETYRQDTVKLYKQKVNKK